MGPCGRHRQIVLLVPCRGEDHRELGHHGVAGPDPTAGILARERVLAVGSSGGGEWKDRGGMVIREHVLDFLLTMNHSEEADNPVPRSVPNLVVRVIDTDVDHLQDVVTKFEIELDSVEFELDRGGFDLKKQLLDDRKFSKMHLDLQRLLLVIAHGEQVFPRVREKCSSKEHSNFLSWDCVDSIWNERRRSSMDGTKEPGIKRWVSKCNVYMCGYAIGYSYLLPFPGSL